MNSFLQSFTSVCWFALIGVSSLDPCAFLFALLGLALVTMSPWTPSARARRWLWRIGAIIVLPLAAIAAMSRAFAFPGEIQRTLALPAIIILQSFVLGGIVSTALALAVARRRMDAREAVLVGSAALLVSIGLVVTVSNWQKTGRLKMRLISLAARQDAASPDVVPVNYAGSMNLIETDRWRATGVEQAYIRGDVARWIAEGTSHSFEDQLRFSTEREQPPWTITGDIRRGFSTASIGRMPLRSHFAGLPLWPGYSFLGVLPGPRFQFAEFPLRASKTFLVPKTGSLFLMRAPRGVIASTIPAYESITVMPDGREQFAIRIGWPQPPSIDLFFNWWEEPAAIGFRALRPSLRNRYLTQLARGVARSCGRWGILIASALLTATFGLLRRRSTRALRSA